MDNVVEDQKICPFEEPKIVVSFKEKSQKKGLLELKKLLEVTSFGGEVTLLWGIPLLGDVRSDFVILKFLRAKGFIVLDAFSMIENTLRWRKEVGIESLLEEDLGNDYEKVFFTHGYDKEGYPVVYMVLEEYLNKNRSENTSFDVDNQEKFLRWLIQFVEKNTRKLDFSPTSTNSFVLVIDLKSSPFHENKDLYKLIHKFLQVLQDNYPEFVAKQLWVNASWWYRTYCRIYSVVFDEWNSNKVVFSGSSKTVETLFKYISPGQVPVKYGGLSRKCSRFTAADPVSEVTIKPASKHTEEFTFAQACDVLWELRVVGWDVSYEAAFVPSMEGRYITYISKLRKVSPSYESAIADSFRVSEPGKLVLTIHNASSKKKKLLLRVPVASDIDLVDGVSLRGWLVHSNE